MIHSVIDQSGVIHIFKGKQAAPIKLMIGEILTAEIMDIFPTGTVQVKINNRIINAQPQRDLPLNKGDTVMVKVEKPLEDGTIPLRVLSNTESEQVKKAIIKAEGEISDKIFKVIETLFSNNPDSSKESKQSQSDILQLMLSLPTESLSETQKTSLLQRIINLIFSNKGTVENIQELIQLLEKNNFSKEQISQLKNLIIISNEENTHETLKQTLLNTGVSYEARIKQLFNEPSKIEHIKEDLKVILNNILKEAKEVGKEEIILKTEKILQQIEGYQLLSKTYHSFFTFLPLIGNKIEGGTFAFKSLKRQGKEYYSVLININFKESNFLSFIVTMIKNNFYISFSGDKEVLNLIKTYESVLREQFIQRGMSLNGIKYLNKFEELLKIWEIKEGQVNITV